MSEGNTIKKPHREVRFGAYVLGSTLGEGEFGKVKLGWRKDGAFPSQVAIKLIKRENIVKHSEAEVKIHREINSLKLLSHPNIVKLVEVMKSGKYIGIVLEYASGGELFDHILTTKCLKEDVAKRLFAQMVSAIDYMHSKGLVHRDLKLENILLDKHRNVVISDFGFVNAFNRDKNDLMKTSCGSPCYAAPELVLTQAPYMGTKVDVWSLGVILYAMLLGYLPFDDDPENEDGSDIVRLYHYICKTPLTFPEFVLPLARDLLRRIIVPDPRKRVGLREIKAHLWLAPHAGMLSVTQSEVETPKKRYSMMEATPRSDRVGSASSALVMNRNGRSYSTQNVAGRLYSNPSVATTSPSTARAVVIPPSPSTTSMNSVSSRVSVPALARNASAASVYSSASVALKAMAHHDWETGAAQRIPLPPPLRPTAQFGSTPAPPSSGYSALSSASAKLPVSSKPRPTSYHPSSTDHSFSVDYLRLPPVPSPKAVSPLPRLAEAAAKAPEKLDSSKRNSLMSFIEDKMALLDVKETPEVSPIVAPVTPPPHGSLKILDDDLESGSGREEEKLGEAPETTPVALETPLGKEKVATEELPPKKRNRFSLLNFYSTTAPVERSAQGLVSGAALTGPLQRSHSTSVAPRQASHSAATANSRMSLAIPRPLEASTTEQRDPSTAKRVMDFFKRRSMRT